MITNKAEFLEVYAKLVNFEVDSFNEEAVIEEALKQLGETGSDEFEIPAREAVSGKPELLAFEVSITGAEASYTFFS